MKTVKCNSTNELIIKNSRFITLLMTINDETDINLILEDVKTQYPKATHYCYAYISKSFKRCSDDGEPGGTAGMPMLNVLEKEKMINTLAIVIRYFGGIKLGAGGLVRAYSKSVREAIINSNVLPVQLGYLVRVTIPYNETKSFDYLIKDYRVIGTEYLDNVTYNILLPVDKVNILTNYSYQIIKEEYIEKELS